MRREFMEGHMNKRTAIHERVLNATDKEDLAAAYAEWADAYDHDLLDDLGYVAPQIAVSMLAEQMYQSDALILDAGCGTGIVGALLHTSGYRQIDGLDYSQRMLDKAGEKAAYKTLSQGDLMSPLPIPDDRYDVVISVGTFTCAHVGPQALNELVRITRPGGCLCFTVRDQAWHEENYRAVIDDITSRGMWRRIEERTSPYIEKEGSECVVCLYEVTS